MKSIKISLLTVAVLALGACSSDSASESAIAGSSIDSLPANTDPVIQSSLSANNNVLQPGVGQNDNVELYEALTGLKLSDWTDANNWQAGNSRAMCEVGQGLKEALSEAMNPDKIKCYVGAVAANAGVSIATDGSDVHMRLTNFPEGNIEPRIRMQIAKNAAGQITTFRMWSCFNFDGVNYSQSEYINQVISDDLSVTSFSKYTGSEGAESYGSVSNVTGQLNASYQWTSKNMSLDRYYNGTFGSNTQSLSVTQGPDNYVISGYNQGSWGQDIFSNAFYAAVQGLNMSSPRDISLGDGTAKFTLDWCYDSDDDSDCSDEGGGNVFTDTDIQSWDGDNRQNLVSASDGDYFTTINPESVPVVGAVSAISFSGDEAWDCSATDFVEADLGNMDDASTPLGAAFAACDAKYAYQDEGGGGYACDAAQ